MSRTPEEELAAKVVALREDVALQHADSRRLLLERDLAFEQAENRRLLQQEQIAVLEADNRRLLRAELAPPKLTQEKELAARQAENRRLKDLKRMDGELATQQAATRRLSEEKELAARHTEILRLQLERITELEAECRRIGRTKLAAPQAANSSRKASATDHLRRKKTKAQRLDGVAAEAPRVGIATGIFDIDSVGFGGANGREEYARPHPSKEERMLEQYRAKFWKYARWGRG